MGRGWTAGGFAAVMVWLEVGGKKVRVELPSGLNAGTLECSVDGRAMAVDVRLLEPGVMSLWWRGGSTGACLMVTGW